MFRDVVSRRDCVPQEPPPPNSIALLLPGLADPGRAQPAARRGPVGTSSRFRGVTRHRCVEERLLFQTLN